MRDALRNAEFVKALVCEGPHPSLGAHAETYGRLIGSWAGTIKNHMQGRSVPDMSIEVHFAWVLDGRAVQDVWITPARAARHAAGATLDWYGSTLRVFDPALEAWQAVWTDPISRYRIELVGRRQGDDIVQIGSRGGRPIRWTFSDISARAFAWHGHVLDFDGQRWNLEVDMRFERSD